MNLPTLPLNVGVSKKLDLGRFALMVVPVASIAVSAAVVFFLVYPKFTQTVQMRAENKELASRVDSLTTKVTVLAALNKAQLESQLSSAEQILPSKKDVFAAVRNVEQAASSNGVLLNQLDVAPGSLLGNAPPAGANGAPPPPGDTGAAGSALKVEIRVSLTSDYRSYLSFLSSLFNLSRIVGIRDLSLSSGGTAEGSPSATLRSSLVVEAYWKTLPAQLGSIESPVETISAQEAQVLSRVKPVSEATASAPAPAPVVPTGKSDLFAPF